MGWSVVPTLKGYRFDPRSGHTPQLWVLPQAGRVREAPDRCFSHPCFSFSLEPTNMLKKLTLPAGFSCWGNSENLSLIPVFLPCSWDLACLPQLLAAAGISLSLPRTLPAGTAYPPPRPPRFLLVAPGTLPSQSRAGLPVPAKCAFGAPRKGERPRPHA